MLADIDFSGVRGANYTPSYACNTIGFWRDYDPTVIEREIGYAGKLGLNCLRVFLSYTVFEREPGPFLDRVNHLVRTAEKNGLSVMLVLFDGCFSTERPRYDWDKNEWIPSPGCMNLGEEFRPKGDAYCLALTERFGSDRNVLFWDVMNEPECTQYLSKEADPEIKKRKIEEICRFVGHYADLLAGQKLYGALTVGSDRFLANQHLAEYNILEKLDVVSFHDYSRNTSMINEQYRKNIALAAEYGKPIIASEIGCACRSNAYDFAIEAAERHNVGYFVWELMIGSSFWNDRHGIVYPDGTIRDPALVAALNGFFPNRSADAVRYDGNAENHASTYIGMANDILSAESDVIGQYVDLLESIALLFEGVRCVPLNVLPTSTVYHIRDTGDLPAAKALLTEWKTVLENIYGK